MFLAKLLMVAEEIFSVLTIVFAAGEMPIRMINQTESRLFTNIVELMWDNWFSIFVKMNN